MVVDLGAEVRPSVVGAELLVSQADRLADLVCVRMDTESPGRYSVTRPVRVLLREGEVLTGMNPPLADQLRSRSRMGLSKDPGELCRLGEDRIDGKPEARELRGNVGARRGARVVVPVQEPLGGHDWNLSPLWGLFVDH